MQNDVPPAGNPQAGETSVGTSPTGVVVPFPESAWAKIFAAGAGPVERAADRAAARWGTELAGPALLAMPGRRGSRRPPSSRSHQLGQEGSECGRDGTTPPVSAAPPMPRAPEGRTGDVRAPVAGG
jgi:hypothetical protein